jgi:hypothetical protein
MPERSRFSFTLESVSTLFVTLLTLLFLANQIFFLVAILAVVGLVLRKLIIFRTLAASFFVGLATESYRPGQEQTQTFWIIIAIIGIMVAAEVIEFLYQKFTDTEPVRDLRWRNAFFAVIGAAVPLLLVNSVCSLPSELPDFGLHVMVLPRAALVHFQCTYEFILRPLEVTLFDIAAGQRVAPLLEEAGPAVYLQMLVLWLLALPSFWASAFATISETGLLKPHLTLIRFLLTWFFVLVFGSTIGLVFISITLLAVNWLADQANYEAIIFVPALYTFLSLLMTAGLASVFTNYLRSRTDRYDTTGGCLKACVLLFVLWVLAFVCLLVIFFSSSLLLIPTLSQ